MRGAMAKLLAAAVLVLLALLVPAFAAEAEDSLFTLTFKPAGATSAEAAQFFSSFETGQNPAFDMSEFRNQTALFITRVRLAPCVVRVQHLHRNVDELYLSTGGVVAVATAFPDGKVVRDVLKVGQSFVIIKNWVHTIYNPDCKEDAFFLSFISGNQAFNTNVAKAALDLPAGPFRPFISPQFTESVKNAVNIFAVDPVCLKRCGFGPVNGIMPAPGGY